MEVSTCPVITVPKVTENHALHGGGSNCAIPQRFGKFVSTFIFAMTCTHDGRKPRFCLNILAPRVLLARVSVCADSLIPPESWEPLRLQQKKVGATATLKPASQCKAGAEAMYATCKKEAEQAQRQLAEHLGLL
jgi:hypothetical protein